MLDEKKYIYKLLLKVKPESFLDNFLREVEREGFSFTRVAGVYLQRGYSKKVDIYTPFELGELEQQVEGHFLAVAPEGKNAEEILANSKLRFTRWIEENLKGYIGESGALSFPAHLVEEAQVGEINLFDQAEYFGMYRQSISSPSIAGLMPDSTDFLLPYIGSVGLHLSPARDEFFIGIDKKGPEMVQEVVSNWLRNPMDTYYYKPLFSSGKRSASAEGRVRTYVHAFGGNMMQTWMKYFAPDKYIAEEILDVSNIVELPGEESKYEIYRCCFCKGAGSSSPGPDKFQLYVLFKFREDEGGESRPYSVYTLVGPNRDTEDWERVILGTNIEPQPQQKRPWRHLLSRLFAPKAPVLIYERVDLEPQILSENCMCQGTKGFEAAGMVYNVLIGLIPGQSTLKELTDVMY